GIYRMISSEQSLKRNDSSSDHTGSIAVLGANGRLGKILVSRLARSHRILELTHDSMDLGDLASIHRALDEVALDVVILTAAMTAVDYCESHEAEAFAINAEGPREIARICADKGIKMVYISTDFVFDGEKNGPYTEGDEAFPINVYGSSKRMGEKHVLEASKENLVVRVSWLFGSDGAAFPEWIIQQAMTRDAVALPEEKTGTPTFCEDLVTYLESLLMLGGNSASGIVHLCNSGSCTWREWGQFCVDAAIAAGLDIKAERVGGNRLEDVAAFIAKRPVNSVLSTERFTRLTGIVPRNWREAMAEHFSQTLKKSVGV
ncbi:MAG TPA: dTDP-4-dehydrorhamnose reductase, partial [Luteolibacter sp.]